MRAAAAAALKKKLYSKQIIFRVALNGEKARQTEKEIVVVVHTRGAAEKDQRSGFDLKQRYLWHCFQKKKFSF